MENKKEEGRKELTIYRWFKFTNKWFIICPFCKHHWVAQNKQNVCPQCKGIFSEDLVKRPIKLNRVLSRELRKEKRPANIKTNWVRSYSLYKGKDYV